MKKLSSKKVQLNCTEELQFLLHRILSPHKNPISVYLRTAPTAENRNTETSKISIVDHYADKPSHGRKTEDSPVP